MKDAHSLLSSRRGWLKTAGGVTAAAALGSLSMCTKVDGWFCKINEVPDGERNC